MQAIVINEAGFFKDLNGKTFEISEASFRQDLAQNRVVLLIPDKYGKTTATDFAFKNILIVDVDKIAQTIFDAANWYGNSVLVNRPKDAYNGLKRWAETHNFKLKVLYNCPA